MKQKKNNYIPVKPSSEFDGTMKVRAKKNLGQHFLTDLSIAERIADTLSDYKSLPVLEVGPGMGVLTQFLIQKGYDLSSMANRYHTSRSTILLPSTSASSRLIS